MPDDVLLTGPQRSGTTLVCSLLNDLPATVALDEPVPVGILTGPELADGLARFVAEQRASLVAEGRARSWVSVSGTDASNHARDERRRLAALLDKVPGRVGSALWRRFANREVDAHLGWMQLDAPVPEPFTLVVKQLASITAALPGLVDRFSCVAIVRNPLATLASWNTLDFKRDGRAPYAERIDPELKIRLDRARDRYDRQVRLLEWFFERYSGTLPRARVIRYEDVCADPARTLSVITPRAAEITRQLQERNQNAIYPAKVIARLSERLLATDGALWSFYERADVERVAAAFVDSR